MTKNLEEKHIIEIVGDKVHVTLTQKEEYDAEEFIRKFGAVEEECKKLKDAIRKDITAVIKDIKQQKKEQFAYASKIKGIMQPYMEKVHKIRDEEVKNGIKSAKKVAQQPADKKD